MGRTDGSRPTGTGSWAGRSPPGNARMGPVPCTPAWRRTLISRRSRPTPRSRPMAETKDRVYADAEIEAKLKENGLTGWYLEDGWLRRKYTTDGWPTTLMLTNAVGYLCEAAYHHADLAITWGKLWVKLKTHSAGGITDKDFALARKIEDTVRWRPEPGSALEGTPNKFVK